MNFDEFRVNPGQPIDLNKFDTNQDGGISDKKIKQLREQVWQELADYQDRLYAESRQSLLIVLQAMDAAGKDSTLDKITKQLNSHGCSVSSFKAPSKEEKSHDFLWRIHDKAPAAGEMVFFNRSHYEDVLIVKVHDWASPEKITQRYQHINNFEELLADRGTRVIKFMLHISAEYQLARFKNRLDNKEKNWKFNPGDLDERKHWEAYMQAFQIAIEKCSSARAPWYVVPAENRRFRDLMIASVMLQHLRDMDPQYPQPDFDSSEFNANSIV
ncbi:MAG: hypothetical protein KTR16_04495 [Acidiferrobacterales bacterium]|nr:hypothetical protein [Acidiferrobacterales bacterium]